MNDLRFQVPVSNTLLEGGALKDACASSHRLPIWVLYKSPSDFPGLFVARLTFAYGPPETTQTHFKANTREGVAAQIPFMAAGRWTWIERHRHDDPKIEGVWL